MTLHMSPTSSAYSSWLIHKQRSALQRRRDKSRKGSDSNTSRMADRRKELKAFAKSVLGNVNPAVVGTLGSWMAKKLKTKKHWWTIGLG